MKETLILLLGQSPDAPLRWAFTGDGAILEADIAPNLADLAPLAARAGDARVLAVLPGEQAAMRVMAAPPRAQSKFRAAAAFLLEDELAENLDTLHVATARHAAGAGLALAVKKTVMDDWREAFAETGIAPDHMAPDFALLPLEPSRAALVCEGDRLFGVFGLQGFAIERPLADALAVMIADEDAVEAVTAFGDADTERVEYLDKPVEWRGGADDASMFRLYAGAVQTGAAPNLLQGAYRKRHDWRAAVGPWRRAAVLAAACLVAVVAGVVADGVRADRLAGRLNGEALALHQAAFPDEASVAPRDHARRVLASGRESAQFLPLSTHFAETLEQHDAIQVDRIRYNAARGEFSINLRFADINELESLKQALAARGVSTSEAGGVRRSGNVFIGELRVSV